MRMPGPAPEPITTTPRQRRVLEQMVRRHTSPPHQVRRARGILAAAHGATNAAAGRRVGMTADTARTWRRRWAAASEAGGGGGTEGRGEGDDPAVGPGICG